MTDSRRPGPRPPRSAGTAGIAQTLRESARVVGCQGEGRPQLAHALDARYAPVAPAALIEAIDQLARDISADGVDYVVGLPEGGLVPAFAFGLRTGRPVILATRLCLDLPDPVTFEEPHSSLGTTHRVYGLRPRDRVVIVEDEVTTGRTLVNAVRALRRAGIVADEAGALVALDDPAMWDTLRAERIALHAAARVPPGRVPGLLGAPAP